MSSLRVVGGLSTVMFATLAFTACSDGPIDPLAGRRAATGAPGAASFDGKVGSTGNSAKSGSIDARVLLDKSGNALLEVRTGTFDDRTNTGVPDGVFQNIQYKVLNGAGKQVVVHTASFNSAGVSKYATLMNLCSNGDDDGDDDRWSACSTKFGSGWTVSIQANLKGVGGDDKRTDVVRADAAVGYLPDVDLSKQSLFVVGQNGALSAASDVTPSTPTTFSVAIPNDKAIAGMPNTFGVQTTCIVMVDNWPQLALPNGQYNKFTNPNAFGYVGSATRTIAAGANGACQFTLSLPEGPHKIVVTAGVLYPGDYDLTNNSTATFSVNAAPQNVPVDVIAQPLQRLGNGVNASTIIALDTAKAAKPVTIRASFANNSTRATAIDCAISANAALNAQPVGSVTNVTVPASGVAVCQYMVNAIALGSFPIAVTATPTTASPTDPNASNNTASGTLVARSGGSFSSVNGVFNVNQDWTNPAGAAAWPIATTLDHQVFQSSQISLLVLPSQGTLGTFQLSGSVSSGPAGAPITFGTGVVQPATLRAANPGEQVCITVGPAASLANAAAPNLVYFAQICSQQASIPGFQAITVNYTQSVSGAVPAASNPLAFTNSVSMSLQLDFTLAGSTSADRASATIRVPVVSQATNCTASFDLTGQSCATQFGAPVVTTP